VETQRQGEIIKGLASQKSAVQEDVTELAKALIQKVRQSEK